MAMVSDPCPHWAVFRLLRETRGTQPASQLSVLVDGDRHFLYCCHSLRTHDMAGNPHVVSVGIDLAPALASQGTDAPAVIESIVAATRRRGGQAAAPAAAARAIEAVGRVLNIAWVGEALQSPASIICPRSSACPRSARRQTPRKPGRLAGIEEMTAQIRAAADD